MATFQDLPTEIVALILHHLYESYYVDLTHDEPPDLDPYLNIAGEPNTSIPYERARECMLRLCLVNKLFNEISTPLLWSYLSFGLPLPFEHMAESETLPENLHYTRIISFSRFRTAGMGRSIGQSARPFVTRGRLLRLLQGTALNSSPDLGPNRLEAVGFAEYMDSAISLDVLDELLSRGGYIVERQVRQKVGTTRDWEMRGRQSARLIDTMNERATSQIAFPRRGSLSVETGTRDTSQSAQSAVSLHRGASLSSSVHRSVEHSRAGEHSREGRSEVAVVTINSTSNDAHTHENGLNQTNGPNQNNTQTQSNALPLPRGRLADPHTAHPPQPHHTHRGRNFSLDLDRGRNFSLDVPNRRTRDVSADDRGRNASLDIPRGRNASQNPPRRNSSQEIYRGRGYGPGGAARRNLSQDARRATSQDARRVLAQWRDRGGSAIPDFGIPEEEMYEDIMVSTLEGNLTAPCVRALDLTGCTSRHLVEDLRRFILKHGIEPPGSGLLEELAELGDDAPAVVSMRSVASSRAASEARGTPGSGVASAGASPTGTPRNFSPVVSSRGYSPGAGTSSAGPAGIVSLAASSLARDGSPSAAAGISDFSTPDTSSSPHRTIFPHLRRLGLCSVLIPHAHFTCFVSAFPHLTHLELTSTSASPLLLFTLAGYGERSVDPMRLRSLSLARCRFLDGPALIGFLCGDLPPFTSVAGMSHTSGDPAWGSGATVLSLEELSLLGDKTIPSPLTPPELRAILLHSPAFSSGCLRSLDLSSTPVTDELLLGDCPAQPRLQELALAHCRGVTYAGIAEFLITKAPGVEALNISGVGLPRTGQQRSMELHARLLGPAAAIAALGPPNDAAELARRIAQVRARRTNLRVVELDTAALRAVQGGAGAWKPIQGRGRRAWYVDTSVRSVSLTEFSDLFPDVPAPDRPRALVYVAHDSPRASSFRTYTSAGARVPASFGWLSHKMEVLRGEGFAGCRLDGLYGFYGFRHMD